MCIYIYTDSMHVSTYEGKLDPPKHRKRSPKTWNWRIVFKEIWSTNNDTNNIDDDDDDDDDDEYYACMYIYIYTYLCDTYILHTWTPGGPPLPRIWQIVRWKLDGMQLPTTASHSFAVRYFSRLARCAVPFFYSTRVRKWLKISRWT